MNGWIIRNAHGSYLTKDLFWFPHDKPEDAYVFSKDGLEHVRQTSKDWKIKPAEILEAKYEDGNVTCFGKAVPF